MECRGSNVFRVVDAVWSLQAKLERGWDGRFDILEHKCTAVVDVAGARREGLHLRVGVRQRRKCAGLVRVRRIHQQHLHADREQRVGTQHQAVVLGGVRVHTRHHLQQRSQPHRPQDRKPRPSSVSRCQSVTSLRVCLTGDDGLERHVHGEAFGNVCQRSAGGWHRGAGARGQVSTLKIFLKLQKRKSRFQRACSA